MMSQLKGIVCAVVSSSTFGLIPFFALPVLGAGVGLNSLMFYRFAISSLVLGGYLAVKGHRLRVNGRELAALSGLGILYALTALFLTHSYLYIPSGIATTIHFLYPVVVTAVMIAFFKDRVSPGIVLAAFMAVLGVYLLGNGGGEGTVSLKGLALVLITVATYALYIVGVNKSCVCAMDGLKMTFYVLFACTVVFGLNLLLRGERLDLPPSGYIWGYLVLLALIPTLISDFTLILAVQHVGSTTTAILGCMEPLTAAGMGVLFLGEYLSGIQLLGILVVLAAVSVVILSGRVKAEEVRVRTEE